MVRLPCVAVVVAGCRSQTMLPGNSFPGALDSRPWMLGIVRHIAVRTLQPLTLPTAHYCGRCG
jgi:hypothetical protein